MKKASKGIALLLTAFLFPMVFLAQDQEFLRGKVLDQKTGEPVVFATVRILGKAKGVITNMDGSFRLPLEYREAGESIEISSMGYEKKEYGLLKLSPNDINIIRLNPGVLSLSEAIIKGKKRRRLSATQIVRRAIRAIPRNYPMREFAAIGYYRDYQLKKNEYVNLNEAILEVVDKGFKFNDQLSTKVRVYDYQNNTAFDNDAEGKFKYDYKTYKKFIEKGYLYNYGGNEFTILRIHDAIRNFDVNSYDFVNVMKNHLVDHHFFKKEDNIKQGDDILYVISFRQAYLKYLAYGKLFISKRDFAIHKMEYALYDRTRNLEKGVTSKHGNNNRIIFEILTEYKQEYGKMFPNYLSFFNTFEVSKPPEFVVLDILLDGPKGCFVVKFNDFIDPETARVKSYYDIRYEGRRIPIKKIKVFDFEVELYPDITNKSYLEMVRKLEALQNKRLNIMQFITAEVNKVLNQKGTAKVNEMKYNTYRQFREYFVQEIKPNGSMLQDTLFMKKDEPIFKDQPIVKPDNFNEYWMNTPLKTLKE